MGDHNGTGFARRLRHKKLSLRNVVVTRVELTAQITIVSTTVDNGVMVHIVCLRSRSHAVNNAVGITYLRGTATICRAHRS